LLLLEHCHLKPSAGPQQQQAKGWHKPRHQLQLQLRQQLDWRQQLRQQQWG
jgi:hypothetical protein